MLYGDIALRLGLPRGATPYTLVYEMEAVLPIEIEVPSLRIMLENKIPEAYWLKERYDELALMDEKRLQALYHTQVYQQRIARAFNKKVRDRNLKEGDMVLKVVRGLVSDQGASSSHIGRAPISSRRF